MHHVIFGFTTTLDSKQITIYSFRSISLSFVYELLRIVIYRKSGRFPIVCSSWIFSQVKGNGIFDTDAVLYCFVLG